MEKGSMRVYDLIEDLCREYIEEVWETRNKRDRIDSFMSGFSDIIGLYFEIRDKEFEMEGLIDEKGVKFDSRIINEFEDRMVVDIWNRWAMNGGINEKFRESRLVEYREVNEEVEEKIKELKEILGK